MKYLNTIILIIILTFLFIINEKINATKSYSQSTAQTISQWDAQLN